MRLYDEIGEYEYESGWCVRDAFRQGLGDDHPVIAQIPYAADTGTLRRLCEHYGFPHFLSFGSFSCSFRPGDPVIWFVAKTADHREGHMVFCRDPRRVLDGRDRGEYLIVGYVLLED